MADLSDVMTALVNIVSGAAYPNGTGQSSILGGSKTIRCYPGWPDPNSLQADLVAGNVDVSVYPLPTERNTTRYPNEWQDSTFNAKHLTLTVAGQTVTVGGTIQAGEAAVIVVDGTPYAYGVLANDTLNSIAAGLGALIGLSSVTGAVITLPAATYIAAAVAVQGTAVKELKRQSRMFQVTVWAPDFTSRDTVAAALDVALARIERITMPDNTLAWIVYNNSPMTDQGEKQQLYRRDLIYTIEYATMDSMVATAITSPVVNIQVGPTGVTPASIIPPTNRLQLESGGYLVLEGGIGYLIL